MAITLTEGRTFLGAVLAEYGTDYGGAARLLRVLRTAFPAVDWETELRTRARSHPAFAALGLSVDWWVDEVIRLSR